MSEKSTSDFLILDVARLLDETALGKSAAEELSKRHRALREEVDKQPVDQRAAFQARAAIALEQERERLRAELLQVATPHIESIVKARGATTVFHKAALIRFEAERDITEDVIKLVDG